MTEVEDTQQTQPTTQGQQVAPEAPVNAASLQATPNPEVPEQQAPATLTAVANGQKLAETKKAPEPVKIDRLAHNEDYVFTDEMAMNGITRSSSLVSENAANARFISLGQRRIFRSAV